MASTHNLSRLANVYLNEILKAVNVAKLYIFCRTHTSPGTDANNRKPARQRSRRRVVSSQEHRHSASTESDFTTGTVSDDSTTPGKTLASHVLHS